MTTEEYYFNKTPKYYIGQKVYVELESQYDKFLFKNKVVGYIRNISAIKEYDTEVSFVYGITSNMPLPGINGESCFINTAKEEDISLFYKEESKEAFYKDKFNFKGFKEYINTYDINNNGRKDNTEIVIKDILYGIGLNLNKDKYESRSGFNLFLSRIRNIIKL